MLNKSIQKKISRLHLSYAFGHRADTIAQNAEREAHKLILSLSDNIITVSPELESLRCRQIKDLAEKVKEKGIEDSKLFVGASANIADNIEWTQDAQNYAKKYEKIIHEANHIGEEIYDTVVRLSVKFDSETLEVISSSVEAVAEKYGFKFKVEMSYFDFSREFRTHIDDVGSMAFYTTTVGARAIYKIITSVCSWDQYRLSVNFHAIDFEVEDFDLDTAQISRYSHNKIDANCSIFGKELSDSYLGECDFYKAIGAMFTVSHRGKGNREWFNYEDDRKGNYTPLRQVKDFSKELGFESAVALLEKKQ